MLYATPDTTQDPTLSQGGIYPPEAGISSLPYVVTPAGQILQLPASIVPQAYSVVGVTSTNVTLRNDRTGKNLIVTYNGSKVLRISQGQAPSGFSVLSGLADTTSFNPYSSQNNLPLYCGVDQNGNSYVVLNSTFYYDSPSLYQAANNASGTDANGSNPPVDAANVVLIAFTTALTRMGGSYSTNPRVYAPQVPLDAIVGYLKQMDVAFNAYVPPPPPPPAPLPTPNTPFPIVNPIVSAPIPQGYSPLVISALSVGKYVNGYDQPYAADGSNSSNYLCATVGPSSGTTGVSHIMMIDPTQAAANGYAVQAQPMNDVTSNGSVYSHYAITIWDLNKNTELTSMDGLIGTFYFIYPKWSIRTSLVAALIGSPTYSLPSGYSAFPDLSQLAFNPQDSPWLTEGYNQPFVSAGGNLGMLIDLFLGSTDTQEASTPSQLASNPNASQTILAGTYTVNGVQWIVLDQTKYGLGLIGYKDTDLGPITLSNGRQYEQWRRDIYDAVLQSTITTIYFLIEGGASGSIGKLTIGQIAVNAGMVLAAVAAGAITGGAGALAVGGLSAAGAGVVAGAVAGGTGGFFTSTQSNSITQAVEVGAVAGAIAGVTVGVSSDLSSTDPVSQSVNGQPVTNPVDGTTSVDTTLTPPPTPPTNSLLTPVTGGGLLSTIGATVGKVLIQAATVLGTTAASTVLKNKLNPTPTSTTVAPTTTTPVTATPAPSSSAGLGTVLAVGAGALLLLKNKK